MLSKKEKKIDNYFIEKKELFLFIEENGFSKNDLFNNKLFKNEKSKWKKENLLNKNFFSHTFFLLIIGDFILIKAIDFNHSIFLFRYYSLKYQDICKRIFGSEKNIVIVSDEQLSEENDDNLSLNKFHILLKDEKTIKSNFYDYLKNESSFKQHLF